MKYELLIVDLDGVVWRGNKIIRDNIEALKLFMDNGVKVIFITNNSSRSRKEYVEKLYSVGLNVSDKDVLTSGFIVAEYLKRRGGKAFVIGEAGLFNELINAGLQVVSDLPKVDYVVVGFDRYLTYNKLAKAVEYILKGALFIATNSDTSLPINGKIVPGTGAIIAAISAVTGKKPDFIAGKPNPWIIKYVEGKYKVNRNKILIIGDRLDTDIQLGKNTNVDTMLVLTGVTKINDPLINVYKPTYVVRSLREAINLIL
ncbi:MAG: haloacid dehalogenase [Thermoprotei archaeon]|nr:MAG: haloacid dehalogenase [Thermoprotei archaeon]